MRIVLDSNVLARAARPVLGPAREVLFRSVEEPHVLLLSRAKRGYLQLLLIPCLRNWTYLLFSPRPIGVLRPPYRSWTSYSFLP